MIDKAGTTLMALSFWILLSGMIYWVHPSIEGILFVTFSGVVFSFGAGIVLNVKGEGR